MIKGWKNLKTSEKIARISMIFFSVVVAVCIMITGYIAIALNRISHKNKPKIVDKTDFVLDDKLSIPSNNNQKTTNQGNNFVPNISQFANIIKKEPLNKNVKNILVMGLDGDGIDKRNRSDTMIIVSLDTEKRSIKLTSVMRDIYVKMPGWSKGIKLNEAYAYGGPGLTVNCINQFLGMDIQEYVVIDFSGFATVIDAIGGIEINITPSELTQLKALGVKGSGNQLLNGRQALAYARIRKIDSDFARTGRQRNIIMQLFKKFWATDTISKISAIDKVSHYLKTNISPGDIYNLAKNTIDSLNRTIGEFSVPSSGCYTTVSSPIFYFYVDFPKQEKLLKHFIYEKEMPIQTLPLLPPADDPASSDDPVSTSSDYSSSDWPGTDNSSSDIRSSSSDSSSSVSSSSISTSSQPQSSGSSDSSSSSDIGGGSSSSSSLE